MAPLRLQYLAPGVAQLIDVGHVFVASQPTSQPHEVSQFTVPHAGSRPVHVALQLAVLQVIWPHAALPPLQVSSQLDALSPVHVIEPHAAEPAQVRLQSPTCVDACPQIRLPQTCWPPPPEQSCVHLPVVQVRLPQASDPEHVVVQSPVVQLVLPHALTPVQSMAQSFVPHVIPRHALSAVQWIAHDALFVQVIVPHAPFVGQEMSHVKPVGHVMLPLPVPVIGHARVIRLHDGQIDGHVSASAGRASAGRLPTMQ
jgi:hypothetical protein